MRQVSLYLSDLEMNWTSSFLFQNDILAIVLHLLLVPVGTVVKPVEHEVAHRPSPILVVVSRCFPLNRKSTLLDTQFLVFSELPVFGEVLVILVFSKPVGLIPCKKWCFRQGATLLWSWIMAGCSLKEGFRISEEEVPVPGVVKCGVMYEHCTRVGPMCDCKL